MMVAGFFLIFRKLSQAHHFEELFGTPTGLTFDHIAAMYDAQYAAVRTLEEFKEELAETKRKTGPDYRSIYRSTSECKSTSRIMGRNYGKT